MSKKLQKHNILRWKHLYQNIKLSTRYPTSQNDATYYVHIAQNDIISNDPMLILSATMVASIADLIPKTDHFITNLIKILM